MQEQVLIPFPKKIRFRKKVLDFFLESTVRFFGLNSGGRFQSYLLEKISPIYRVAHNDVTYAFHCPNTLIRWRLETFFTKEPETIEWIDSFEKEDVFFDIGANIGLYAVYAGLRGYRTVAFEPDALNYSELNRNIFLNKISDKVMALSIAISNERKLHFLFVPNFSPGGALNSFGESLDWQHKEFVPAFAQGMISCSLDQFLDVYSAPFPNHIKIDVDGLESRIINGTQKTLQDRRVKSVLVELCDHLKADQRVTEQMRSFGFRVVGKYSSPLSDFTALQKGVYNHIFRRE